MTVRPVLHRLDSLRASVGGILLLGLAGCMMAPKIVGPVHTPIPPSKVKVFVFPHAPRHYEVVAKLDASGLGGCSSEGVDRIVLATLRKQAARLGANGLLLIPDRHFHPTVPSGQCQVPPPYPYPPVTAKAIYFPRLKSQGGL